MMILLCEFKLVLQTVHLCLQCLNILNPNLSIFIYWQGPKSGSKKDLYYQSQSISTKHGPKIKLPLIDQFLLGIGGTKSWTFIIQYNTIQYIINWQPSLKGLIQEIHEYDWFNLLAYGSGTERYQYRIHSNHNLGQYTDLASSVCIIDLGLVFLGTE